PGTRAPDNPILRESCSEEGRRCNLDLGRRSQPADQPIPRAAEDNLRRSQRLRWPGDPCIWRYARPSFDPVCGRAVLWPQSLPDTVRHRRTSGTTGDRSVTNRSYLHGQGPILRRSVGSRMAQGKALRANSDTHGSADSRGGGLQSCAIDGPPESGAAAAAFGSGENLRATSFRPGGTPAVRGRL